MRGAAGQDVAQRVNGSVLLWQIGRLRLMTAS